MMRAVWIFAAMAMSVVSLAGTITVTSPNAGDFLGKNNTVKLTVQDAYHQVRVVVTATNVADPTVQITSQQDFDPDADHKINGSMPLNFSDSTPEGQYRITVVPSEPGATYNTITPFLVNVDVNIPRFKDTNPITGSFVRGIVPISAALEEHNMKEWRVQISSRDIPNNSGTTDSFVVNWDTSSIRDDGGQTITIKAEDLAKNTNTKTISVTVDRVAPSITVQTPSSGARLRPKTNIAVAIDLVDQFANSVNINGITVSLQRLDGSTIGLVARRSIRANGNTMSWSGRIQYSRALPSQFRLVVRAVDRAGNQAVTQVVPLKIGN